MSVVLSCFDIADYFISIANETGSFISNLKLQKLVYYAQAWHIALYDSPLFEEDFEAWVHGPVIPSLYKEYKSFGWQPIFKDAAPELSNDVCQFLDEVAEEYFACDAYELEQMTHAEDPWNWARRDLAPDEPSNEVIKKEWMKEFYGARVKED
ncbi:MAG: type II toxin-antitoxin system antitoxin SocA domain-containing protein [Elainellaceae cyanobacterium]